MKLDRNYHDNCTDKILENMVRRGIVRKIYVIRYKRRQVAKYKLNAPEVEQD
ncbi:MAG TPA: hypothetical protein VJ771_08265 [Candidatus Nitrosotalea sp.]|nr:hypothetical protein [Candidatus Nitrosotalea sp.]